MQQYKDFNKFVLKIFSVYDAYRQHWYENINKMFVHCYNECAPHFKLALPVCGVDNTNIDMLYELPLEKDVEVIGCSLKELPSKSQMITFRDGVYYARHIVRLSIFIPGKVIVKDVSNELAFSYGKGAAILDLVLKIKNMVLSTLFLFFFLVFFTSMFCHFLFFYKHFAFFTLFSNLSCISNMTVKEMICTG